MAQQPQSPSMSLQDGHQNDHHHPTHIKSNADVPVDPNIAASSPTYPPYSPYAGHDMSHYQGHAPPPGYPQHWPQQYAGHPHGMPGGPYSSPGTGGSAQGTPASAGPRSSQVRRRVIPSTPLTLLIHSASSLTRYPRSIHSCQFRVPSSTSVRVAVTRRLSECISVGGRDVRRHTVH